MKTRFFALMLALVMVLSLLPATAFAAQGGDWGASGDNVTWSFENGVLTISGYGEMREVEDVWSEDGDFLGTTAPWYGLGVTEVVVGDGVSNISTSAFAYLTTLKTVTLPDSVTVIGDWAFENCMALETIDLPPYLTDIGYGAFYNCSSLTGPLEIPEQMTVIEDEVFEGCASLTEVTLHDGITYIGYAAFMGSGLETVTIPAAVEYIDSYAFSCCPDLLRITVDPANEYYDSENGVLYTEGYTCLEQVPTNLVGTFTIPDTVTEIWNDLAFEGCIGLEGIVIPAALTYIPSGLFMSCEGLKTFEVDDENPVYYDADGILYGRMPDYSGEEEVIRNALVAYPRASRTRNFVIPEGVEMLDAYCFYGADVLYSVTVPASCEVISSGIFEGCTDLCAIWIDDGNPSYYSDDTGVVFNREMTVPEYDPATDTFYDRTYPEGTVLCFFPVGRGDYYEIPEGVTTLLSSSFSGSAIEAVKFPATLESLGYWSMENCDDLTWLLFPGDKPVALDGCLDGVTATVHYPADNDTWADPKFTDSWGELTYVPYGPDEIPVWPGLLPPGTSGTCGENLTWELADGTLTIYGTGAMDVGDDDYGWLPYAEEITTAILQEGVTTVGDMAFGLNYPNLTHVELPSTLTGIGANAFAHACSLTDVVLPEGLTRIGTGAFLKTAITGIVIPDSVTTIGAIAFEQCEQLTYAKLPAGLQKIELLSQPMGEPVSGIFSHCTALTEVDMPVYAEGFSLGRAAFESCTSLTDIDFYTGTVIDSEMFKGCTGLTDITIGRNVTGIGTAAFQDCTGLSTVTFEGSAPAIGKNAFRNDILTAYHPSTWPEDVLQNYGGDITWISCFANPFTDVPEDSFYYDPVLWALENGITSGTGDGTTFSPNDACLRAQVVTFLWRAEGCPEPESDLNPFTDVKETDFFYKAVLWAVEKGITTGTSQTTFSPMGVCNRAQVVTFLHRCFGSPEVSAEELPFTDVPAGSWYAAPIAWAVENGVTNGLSATEFGPNASCNRAQIVTFLYRAYN